MQTAVFPRINGKFKCIPFNEILYIGANRNYSDIFTLHGQKVTVCSNLSAVESKLPERYFCRVHRSYIVSLHKIDEFDHSLISLGMQEIPISKSYFEQLTKRLITFSTESEKTAHDEVANLYIEPKRRKNIPRANNK